MPDGGRRDLRHGSASARVVAAQDRFIQAWGAMAGAWGVSRTMAEAHALLYIVGEPMNTDDVMDRLNISRGNASMTLRALVDWGLITRAHRRGERKEYFAAEQDVWAVMGTLLRERKKRELDPLIVALHEIRDATRASTASDDASAHNARLDAMLDFVGVLDRIADRMLGMSPEELREATRALAALADAADHSGGPR